MKILVGLSGGVDSAVAAYLLKQEGHEVTGAFMRNWDAFANQDILGNPTISDPTCPQEVDYHDAQVVAEQLGIDLLRIDFVKEYWDDVFQTFINETKRGWTPNPDILCNRYIKFDAFYDFAMKHGFDEIAMGHYARLEQNYGRPSLFKARDLSKDQTYFLDQVLPDRLAKARFPLGNLNKTDVRAIAEKLNLVVAKKKDSTGICFIGERHYREFLHNYVAEAAGDIIDVNTGEAIGAHHGVMYYTIGQRHGLGIGGVRGPWFVVGKDLQSRRLYVTTMDHPQWLYSDRCVVSRLNWHDDQHHDQSIQAKFRYRQKDNPVRIHWLDEAHLEVECAPSTSALTLGQEAVFYDGDRCLGGGQIEQATLHGLTFEQRIAG